MPNQSPVLDDVFKALADPTRRAVVARLSQGSASVKELAQPFEMALPSFMQHLRILEQSGMVRTRKSGRVRTCEMEPNALSEAETWLKEQRAMWEHRLDRLEAYLEELQTDESKDGGDG